MRRINYAAGVLSSALVVSLAAVPGPAQARDGNDIDARKRQVAAAGGTKAAPGSREAAAGEATRGTQALAGDTVRLVVGFKDGVTTSAAANSLRGAGVNSLRGAGVNGTASAQLAKLGARTVTVPRANSTAVAAELRSDTAVAYVEEDAVMRAAVDPNDPFYPDQTELPQITVPQAWDTTTGSEITVAVVDTGVSEIGDLAGAVLDGRDLVNDDYDASDDHGHGTAVSSLIAARGNNGAGIAGVCWSCKILPVKVLNSEGSGHSTTTAAGIVWAADQGAKIINASLGGYGSNTVQADAVAYAQSRGAIVVAAAGNEAVGSKHYPAAYNGVVAVGGTDTSSDWFVGYDPGSGTFYGSNYGPDWVDVAAPWCTYALDLATAGYDYFCGTSAATPLVSGTLALMKSRQPGARNAALLYSLTRTAKATPTGDFTQWGEIRAAQAVNSTDASNPRVTGASPGHGARFRGAVTVTATGVSDAGSGVSHVELWANGRYVGRDYSAPYAVRYNSGKSNGSVRFVVRAVDRAGNWADYTRYMIADNKAPGVSFSKAPKNKAKVKGTVTIKAGAGDASGIARVELLVNGKVVARDYKAGYAFKLKVSKYAKKLKVQLRAVDKVGNTKTVTRNWKR
ncbi:S8 family serine peptidase [Actinoplanes sp. GCM10030250]|uniref:S8 family serine peptidase n=1 Tax=Actinoplanes sp. GCM10030250 TaxID=3273376 RepID=UPI0036137360